MADAKRCDRCEDFYMPQEEFIVKPEYKIIQADGKEPDLCRSCHDALEAWMSNDEELDEILKDEKLDGPLRGEIPVVTRLRDNKVHVKTKSGKGLIFDDFGDSDEMIQFEYFNRLNHPESYEDMARVEVTFQDAKPTKTPHMTEIQKNSEGKYHKQRTGDLYKNSAKIAEMTKFFIDNWELDALQAKRKAYYVVFRAKKFSKDLNEYFEEFKEQYAPEKPEEAPKPVSDITPHEHIKDQPKAYRARLIEDVAEVLQDRHDIDWTVAKNRARLELIKNEQNGILPADWYNSYMKPSKTTAEIQVLKYKCSVCEINEVMLEKDICATCSKHMDRRQDDHQY
jgi:hypothetical protein